MTTTNDEPARPGLTRGDAERRWGWNNLMFAGLAVAVLGLMGMLGWSLARSSVALEAGAAAPDIDFETFGGERITSADLRGKVVVLNFWASWCLPCAEEAADLEAIWRDYRARDVMVLGVAYTDTRPAALAYIERLGVTYPNGMDRAGALSRRYGLSGVPETVVIDAAGRLAALTASTGGGPPIAKIVGPIVPTAPFTPADLRATLDRLVAERAEKKQ